MLVKYKLVNILWTNNTIFFTLFKLLNDTVFSHFINMIIFIKLKKIQYHIVLSFAHPHVIPNLYDFFLL